MSSRSVLSGLLIVGWAGATAVLGDTFTADELAKIKSIGSAGRVVWQRGKQWNHNDPILTYELGFTAEPVIKEIGKGMSPSMSSDGKLVAWFECVSCDKCNIVVADSDGSNKRIVNKSVIQYGGYLRWTNTGTLVFNAGPKTVRTPDHASQQVWEIDLEGRMTKLVDESGFGDHSYAYASFIDKHGDWVTWRHNAIVYAGKFAGTPLNNTKAVKVRENNACAQAFSPGGDTLTTNGLHHNAIHFYRATDGSWSEQGWIRWTPACIDNVGCEADGARQTAYHWSNRSDWMVARREAWAVGANGPLAKCIVALNIRTTSGQKETGGFADPAAVVRLTNPPSGEDHAPSLYIGAATEVTPVRSRSSIGHHVGVGTMYTIDGSRITSPSGAAGVVIGKNVDGSIRRVSPRHLGHRSSLSR